MKHTTDNRPIAGYSREGLQTQPATSYSYDALLNVDSVTDANNDTTYYHHDTLSRRDAITDPEGNLTQFEFDDLDQVVGESITVGGQTLDRSFQYDLLEFRGHHT